MKMETSGEFQTLRFLIDKKESPPKGAVFSSAAASLCSIFHWPSAIISFQKTAHLFKKQE